MGETVALGLLLLLKKALDSALEKGISIALAATKQEEKYDVRYHVSDWDGRPECLRKENDEKEEGEG